MITNLKKLKKHVKLMNKEAKRGHIAFPIVSLSQKHFINRACKDDLKESYDTCIVLSAMHKAQRYTKKNQR